MDFELVTSSQLSGRTWLIDGPVMILPCTDAVMAKRAGQHAAARAGVKGLVLAIEDELREGFVSIMNQACRVTHSPWVGYMAQEAFAGRQWMSLALTALVQRQGVFVGFNDGKWQGALASFGLAQRGWAAGNYEQGEFFYPKYQRHYADAELTVLARQVKGYVYEPNSVLLEVDWGKDAQAVHQPDRVLYRQRAQDGFDGMVSEPKLRTLFG